MSKGFFDVFTRYNPDNKKRAVLESATDAKFKYQKQPMRVEVELTFDRHYDADIFYDIEDECRTLYNAESFKILPHFPTSEYNVSRWGEIAYEASLFGAVTRGFLSMAEYEDDGETVHIRIPFNAIGIDFVVSADTEAILARILLSRYGVTRRVRIVSKIKKK